MKNIIPKLITLAILTGFLTAGLGTVAYAADTKRPPIIPKEATEAKKEPLILPNSADSKWDGEMYLIGILFPKITTIVITFAAALSVLYIIIGSIQILVAYGEDEKITSAKNTIQYAIVGLIISILSYAIVSIISALQL
jgi:hypothetical protein